jgi:hypothetical protein
MKRALIRLLRALWMVIAFAATVVRAVLAVLVAVLFGWRYGTR